MSQSVPSAPITVVLSADLYTGPGSAKLPSGSTQTLPAALAEALIAAKQATLPPSPAPSGHEGEHPAS